MTNFQAIRRTVEGIAKCGMGNWHRMAEKFVKTKTPQQICNYSVEYFRRVRSTSLRATRYIEAKSRSTATSVGPSNKMDIMINVAPRAKKPASKRLRKLVSRGLGGIHNPRWWTIGSSRSKKLVQGSSLRMPMESALGQQPVLVSAPSVVPVPVSAPAAIPVSNVVPLRTSEMETPQMLRLFPVEVPLFPLSAERGSASSSVSGDHGDGKTEDEDELGLDLTLG